MRRINKQFNQPPGSLDEEFYPGLADFRRSVLFDHTTLPCDVLEIGAFATPTISPSEARLKVLDFFTTDELVEQAKLIGTDPEKVIPVDYVCQDDNLAVVTEVFDIVIANHVFEHIDNPIKWLQDIRSLMREDGVLLLVLPDKKYSFDKFRPDTPVSHLLYDYFAPDRDLKEVHALETALYYDLTYIGQKNNSEYKFDAARLHRSLAESHPGIHCHVFQAETFETAVIKPLLFMGLVDMHLLEVRTCRQFGEFAIVLQAGVGKTRLEGDEFFVPAADTVTDTGIERGVTSHQDNGCTSPAPLTASSYDGDIERQELTSSRSKKLNLGAGYYPLDGWINIDNGDGVYYPAPANDQIVRLDVFQALGLTQDESIEYITSEQFFEHFTRQDGLRLMQECFRVLMPSGVMRLQVPDLEMVIGLYRNELEFADWETVQLPHRLKHIDGTTDAYGKLMPGESYTPAMMINNGFHMDGHKFLYDYQTISQSLSLAGFMKIKRETFSCSSHSQLSGIDRHDGGSTGKTWVPKVALIVEAEKAG